ncbi:MAG TPA: hypothetical protein DCZ03_08245, partial [Gammaproteobacteria bacterium]|nr:hypothetical protein [Gammaproteobacteria bacterium]
ILNGRLNNLLKNQLENSTRTPKRKIGVRARSAVYQLMLKNQNHAGGRVILHKQHFNEQLWRNV